MCEEHLFSSLPPPSSPSFPSPQRTPRARRAWQMMHVCHDTWRSGATLSLCMSLFACNGFIHMSPLKMFDMMSAPPPPPSAIVCSLFWKICRAVLRLAFGIHFSQMERLPVAPRCSSCRRCSIFARLLATGSRRKGGQT